LTLLSTRRTEVIMSTVRGSCLCGDVAWEVEGSLDLMSHCYCSRCRKAHGTAFATYVMGPADGLSIVWISLES